MPTRAEVLRNMRLEKRLTQSEVAERLKVSQSYYSQIERGQKSGDIAEAMEHVNKMRTRGNRTGGGDQKAGRRKD
jgi:transcriptional regulator with XRE-family HTH domain